MIFQCAAPIAAFSIFYYIYSAALPLIIR